MPSANTMRGLRLNPELEGHRDMISVDPEHRMTMDELLAMTGSFDPADPRRIDRLRVIVQVQILNRLHRAGRLTDAPRQGWDEATGHEAQALP